MSNTSPLEKYAENMQAWSMGLHAPLVHPAKPEEDHEEDSLADDVMMRTLVEGDEPLVQDAAAAPRASLISSEHSTGVSSSLSMDMDLVDGINPMLDWGKKSAPAASVASMSQQNSYVAPTPVAGHANPYLEGIPLPAPAAPQHAASMVKKSSLLSTANGGALKTKTIQQVLVVDKLDQSKLKGALSAFLFGKKPAETPVVLEQQQEQQQPDGEEDPYNQPKAMDNYVAWAHSL